MRWSCGGRESGRERRGADELQQTCAVKSGLVIDSLSQWVGQAGSRVGAGALVFSQLHHDRSVLSRVIHDDDNNKKMKSSLV